MGFVMKKKDLKKIESFSIEDISLSNNCDYPDSEILMYDECQINDFR